jgi:hypothetical protein
VSFRSLSGHVETVPPSRFAEVRSLLGEPADACFAEARLFPVRGGAPEFGRASVLGYYRAGQLAGAVLLGANLVPIATDETSRQALAAALIRSGRRCSSIVGPADEVLPLWNLLTSAWGPARQVRPEQPLMAIAEASSVAPDPLVQPVSARLLSHYLPASIAMFTEEVGVDPRLGGLEQLYRDRVADLLRAGWAFARWSDDRVLFKAELGAVSERAVQVQGVWVDPRDRGRGLAAGGMAAVVARGLQVAPVVSLYVNAYNAPALATYRRVGFRQVGTYATVLF